MKMHTKTGIVWTNVVKIGAGVGGYALGMYRDLCDGQRPCQPISQR